MNVIKNKKIFFIISGILVVASLVGWLTKGLSYGIEFTGGSLVEATYVNENGEDAATPDVRIIREQLSEAGFDANVQAYGEGIVVRTQPIGQSDREVLFDALSVTQLGENGEQQIREANIGQLNSVGPSIGEELRKKAIIGLILVSLAIILFVAYAFYGVSINEKGKQRGPSSWLYGFVAVVALFHDIILPTGLSAWFGIEVNPLFVVGLLSILGLSVNDTIVVFDRVRENLDDMKGKPFNEIVGASLSQTITRSINTSLTLIVALVALYILGPVATRDLALIMIVGTAVGTYSSIFLAAPLLTQWYRSGKENSKDKSVNKS